MSARRVARAAVAIGAIAASSMYATPSAHASVVVNGAGSTWSSIAVDQWRADVSRFNININFNAVGSTAGRTFFIQKQVDFAVSEIPFQAAYKDPSGTHPVYVVLVVSVCVPAYLSLCCYEFLVRTRNETNKTVTAIASGWPPPNNSTAEGTPADALQHCIGACEAIRNLPGCCIGHAFLHFLLNKLEDPNTNDGKSDIKNNKV